MVAPRAGLPVDRTLTVFPQGPRLDIVWRAAFVFFLILLLTPIVGRREPSSLQPFDLILRVVIGDLVQQGVTQSDYSLTGVILAIGTFSVLSVVVSYASFKVPRIVPASAASR